MISVVVCSQIDTVRHQRHIAATIGAKHEYIHIDNSDNRYGLCSAYNEGVRRAKYGIIAFVHDDVYFATRGWGKVLKDKFKNPAVGAVGVAGTNYLFEDNPLWVAAGMPYLHGMVVHDTGGRHTISIFSETLGDRDAVAIDGLFMAVRKSLFDSISFDEETFPGFHFYDLDICMQTRRTHRILATTDVLVKHLSGGKMDEKWSMYAKRFIEKYRGELPASCVDTAPDRKHIIPFKSLYLENTLSPDNVRYIENINRF